MKDLPLDFLMEVCSKNMEFLENKTGEIPADVYLLYIAEVKNRIRHIGTGAPLIVNNYILSLISGNDSRRDVLVSRGLDEKRNLMISGQWFKNLVHYTHWKTI